MVDKDKVEANIFLQQVSILLPKKKKKTFFILNTFSVK